MGGAKKFFTRSALVQQLIPNPSEGQVRALFGTGKCSVSEAQFKPQSFAAPDKQVSRMSENSQYTQTQHRKAASNQTGMRSGSHHSLGELGKFDRKRDTEPHKTVGQDCRHASTAQNNIFLRMREAATNEGDPPHNQGFGGTMALPFGSKGYGTSDTNPASKSVVAAASRFSNGYATQVQRPDPFGKAHLRAHGRLLS